MSSLVHWILVSSWFGAMLILMLNLCLVFLYCFQNHKLPLSYNFHKYMVRSMEDEFHGIVGIRYALIWLGTYQSEQAICSYVTSTILITLYNLYITHGWILWKLHTLMKLWILPNSAPAEQMYSQFPILLISLPEKTFFFLLDVFLLMFSKYTCISRVEKNENELGLSLLLILQLATLGVCHNLHFHKYSW